MKRILLFVAILALALTALTGLAEEPPKNLGEPMPDFTFVSTDGENITLSEVLKEKQLVHLSLFASWCPPCKAEFPEMEAVYQDYSDRMEIFALTAYPKDTMELMTSYKADMGLSFPFGLTAGTSIEGFIDIPAYPTNVFIDKFGNVAYIQVGSFPAKDIYQRVVDYFLSDDYTETKTLLDAPVPVMDVPLPDPARLAEALNVEGGSIAFESVDDGETYPFVVEDRGDGLAAYAGNVGVTNTLSMLNAHIDAGEGGAVSFEVACDVNPIGTAFGVEVDGQPGKVVTGKHDFTTFVLPLSAGEHDFVFFYYLGAAPKSDADFVALKNVALLTGDAAAEALAQAPVWPVAEETAIELINPDYRMAVVTQYGATTGATYYLLDDEILRFRITLAEGADPEEALVVDEITGNAVVVSTLPVEDGAFIFECPNATPTTSNTVEMVTNYYTGANMQQFSLSFCHGEGADVYPRRFVEQGYEDIGWCFVDELTEDGMDPNYAEEEPAAEAAPTEATYTVYVVDQNGDPVPEAAVGFCIDNGCMPIEADDNGVATYTTQTPTRYHLKVVDAPDEYDYPDDTDIYIGPETGEQTLVITKEG